MTDPRAVPVVWAVFATFRIGLEDESIVATGIHRLWKAGKGWTMARELKPGDILRTLGGIAAVKSVVEETVQPVFNLQVADGESYFVGRSGVLAHDNSTINPTPEPFDAVVHARRLEPGPSRRLAAERSIHAGVRIMLSILVVCFGLIASMTRIVGRRRTRRIGPPTRRRQAKAGHDAKAHVRLALWCESHGMTAERMKHLAMAVLYDPSNALARGLMGLVAYKGKWDRPDVVGREIQDDPAYRDLIREYLERRAQTAEQARRPGEAGGLVRAEGAQGAGDRALLGGRPAGPVARGRLAAPGLQEAGGPLGQARGAGRRAAGGRAAAARRQAVEAEARAAARRPGSKDAARRARAEAAIAEVTDPRAVPMIWAVFVRGNERSRIAAVQMLGQIDGPSASNALAALAIFNPLGRGPGPGHRDPRPPRPPRRHRPVDRPGPQAVQVRGAHGPDGPGTAGELFVEGERFNVQRFYQNPPIDPEPDPASHLRAVGPVRSVQRAEP